MKADLTKLRIAAVLGFLAVALGALGAHGLETHWKATLGMEETYYRLTVWKTASLYHIVHAVVLLILAFGFSAPGQGRWSFGSFLGGVVIFSGSLYVLCLTGVKWLGAVTPVGGLLLMLGWVLLMFRPKLD